MKTILRDCMLKLSPEIFKTLREVFWGNVVTTKAIQKTLKEYQHWEDPKRASFSQTVYDLTRWWRSIWNIIDIEPSSEDEPLEKLINIYLFIKKGDITALQKKQGLNAENILQRIHINKTSRVLRESIPDWLDAQGGKRAGITMGPCYQLIEYKSRSDHKSQHPKNNRNNSLDGTSQARGHR
ncbi:hypothetical protein AYK25_00150 [Thermoplasmatales archaeon SM1-50]|nr:MAG: hypothetical protein AYK25_00150 [Thermoplasmatales archaeon SM1-50]